MLAPRSRVSWRRSHFSLLAAHCSLKGNLQLKDLRAWPLTGSTIAGSGAVGLRLKKCELTSPKNSQTDVFETTLHPKPKIGVRLAYASMNAKKDQANKCLQGGV